MLLILLERGTTLARWRGSPRGVNNCWQIRIYILKFKKIVHSFFTWKKKKKKLNQTCKKKKKSPNQLERCLHWAENHHIHAQTNNILINYLKRLKLFFSWHNIHNIDNHNMAENESGLAKAGFGAICLAFSEPRTILFCTCPQPSIHFWGKT